MISDQTTEKIQLHPTAVQEVFMQPGSIIMFVRKHGPAVWQFRWSETGAQGQRVYRKRVVGTIEEYADSEAVREAFKGLVAKPTPMIQQMKPVVMTLGELCQHFQERELVQDDSWRSYSTRKNYSFLLKRWIIPRWEKFGRDALNSLWRRRPVQDRGVPEACAHPSNSGGDAAPVERPLPISRIGRLGFRKRALI